MTATLTRSQALRCGVVGALGLAVAPTAAARASAVPDGDLAYLRLLAAAELLKADFAATALRAKKLPARTAALLRRLDADDRAHYDALAVLANGAGQRPPTGGDIDFSYPVRAFASVRSQLELGIELTTLTLGAYVGALQDVQTPELRRVFAQIAANEAQQWSALESALGRAPVGKAFAPALTIDAVSAQLDRFES